MKYQKIINLLDNRPNEPSKFRTRNWVGINDESRGNYDANNDIKSKALIIRSSLCDYSDTYIHVKGIIRIPNIGTVAAPDNRNKR